MSFNLTRKTDYGLVALSFLAKQKLADGDPLSARTISEQYNLPQQLLMNVLKDLHRAEILASKRGANGGYYLERSPERITLKEVIEAIEGPVNVTLCSEHHSDDAVCNIATLCPINGPMLKVNHLFSDFLEKITIVDLLDNEVPSNLPFMGVNV